VELNQYKSRFLEYLIQKSTIKQPNNLYEPIDYILKLGGKRLRPILALMSSELFGADYRKALDAALAIEMFHNFTLIHDDIMDKASLRRGKETVHIKWNKNIGILSGDALLILSYRMLENYDGDIFKKLYSLFNTTALQICEGQQYDMDFETRENVLLEDYLKMVSFKTAVLLACSLQMGAIIADANDKDVEQIYNFGLQLGIAFQLQDDYLDAFGTEEFGKKVGGDISENKKTFLYIKTLELTSSTDREELLKWYNNDLNSETKIQHVKELFTKYQVDKLLLGEIEKYTLKAFESIEMLSLSDAKKNEFINFGKSLMHRKI
jgi:geranylgeranyl diphosphate synthase type II